jgi:hypothetical protein
LKNKVSSLEDYAVEVIQETEKDFNNAMGQESLTLLINLKEKKQTKTKVSSGKQTGWRKYRKQQKASKYHPIRCKRKACNNKKTNNYY